MGRDSQRARGDGKTAVGEIACRGHNVMDADGYHYIVDRPQDINIRGGYNVYPREIE